MTLSAIDWIIIAAYFAISAAIGLAFAGRARRSLADYFVSGRSLPWWLAGTSMVATTFAADTPLAVSGMVARHGVAGNWLWWNLALSGLLTVFFFSRLWRRAGVVTDVEFTELRYSGKPAAVLRATRALYLALPINLIIMGWVTRAMVTIIEVSLGWSGWAAALALFAITAVYSTVAGLWAVVVTDFVQFLIAMAGCIVLAVLAVDAVGGLDQLATATTQHFGSRDAALGLFPPLDSPWLPLSTLLVYLAVQWWAVWYPGAEPGGGGYVAQRMLSSKDERHSLLATLWFNVAHYAIRPWPWIIVGLVTVVRYPGLANPEEGYVRAMVDLLPAGLRGLMLAAFAAAYMSTIATHLNWGASYLVNDVYLRFARRRADDREQVLVGRIATGALMVLAFVVMQFLGSVEAGWKILLALGAGTGLVLILRWYWWRINAWSELAAMAASLVTSIVVQAVSGYDAADPSGKGFAVVMLWTVGVTTAVWLAVTFLTPPESAATLEAFYRRVRPGGPGWRAVAERLGFGQDRIPGGALSWVNWIAGWVAVFATLAGTGQLLLGSGVRGVVGLAAAAGALALIMRNLRADRTFASVSVDTGTGSS
ncbi:MAG TPA: sodium:solute symporter family protein [Gemmatimonadales bacterium]|jgi:SSS family transporter|nr:sodium:solute symporter family protein [Gemmatimonadales bacterium]